MTVNISGFMDINIAIANTFSTHSGRTKLIVLYYYMPRQHAIGNVLILRSFTNNICRVYDLTYQLPVETY